MNKANHRSAASRCGDCGHTVTVVDEPAAHQNDDPHWAEAYTEKSSDYQLCWQCGRVLWAPL